MKTKLFIVGIILVGMMSCKGSSGKKVIDAGKRAYKEFKAFSESDARKCQKLRKKQQQFEEIQQSFQSYQSSPCWQCQGWGVVGYIDENGYFMTDNNGDILTATCPECGGTGIN